MNWDIALRFLKKNKLTLPPEKTFLDFFVRSAIKITEKKEESVNFSKLKQSLEKESKSPWESLLLKYFDFRSWIESKIENRSFLEITLEKSHAT